MMIEPYGNLLGITKLVQTWKPKNKQECARPFVSFDSQEDKTGTFLKDLNIDSFKEIVRPLKLPLTLYIIGLAFILFGPR